MIFKYIYFIFFCSNLDLQDIEIGSEMLKKEKVVLILNFLLIKEVIKEDELNFRMA